MAAPPTSAPPAELAAKALPYLSARVSAAVPSGPGKVVPALEVALRTLARVRLAPSPSASPPPVPLAPLHAFVSLCLSDPTAVSIPLLADAILAYPAEVGELARAVEAVLAVPGRRDELVSMVSSASSALSAPSPSPPALLATARLMHGLTRLPSAAGIVYDAAGDILPALCKAYDGVRGDADADAVVTRAKAETLVLLRVLISHSPGLRASLPPRRGGTPLLDANVTADYELFGSARPRADVAKALRAIHETERRDDPRLAPLLALFPSLPAHLLADALAHPRFSGGTSRASPEEQAAPLVDAILARSLPAELAELRAAAAAMDGGEGGAETEGEESRTRTPEPGAAASRRGAWDAADLARLRVKDRSGGTLGADIPDTMRASILRLVEAQAEEAAAAERAVAEARGMWRDEDDEEDEEGVMRPPRVRDADGDDSGVDGEGEGEGDVEERTNTRSAQAKGQTVLELAYLRDPAVFSRDAATRRGTARADLRDKTGMDDGQIEGWKIMLERNPHKDAILERHQWSREAVPRGGGGSGGGGGAPKPKKDGGRGDKGGNTGGGGGGGSRGGRGGQSGRGRGANKGSRGHANAKRTGGHDKKMSRMGAGL